MPRGLNTETEQRLLGRFQYPEFSQVTCAGGVTRPRRADAVCTPSGIEAWKGQRTGVDDYCRVYSVEAGQEYYAFASKAGGTLQLYEPNAPSTFDALAGAPTERPEFSHWDTTAAKDGLAYGVTAVYSMAWLQEGHFAYGLGPTANVKNDSMRLSVTVDTGDVPEDGATITNSTKSATAKYRGNSGGSGPSYLFFINESEKSTEDVWENSDSLTWTGGTGTMGADEIKNDVESSGFYWLRPVFSAPASPPAGIDYFMLFRLEENTGYYRALVDREDWDTTWSVSGEALDMSFFPYDHSSGDTYENPGELLPLWPGPYDADGLPETIMDALDSVQSVAWHKNCLFAAEGNIIRMSEPEKPCYFREAFSLDAGDDVLKMVSRDELLEVYTPTGIKYVVGASPYFELRETGITEGPVSRDSIVKTDVGTFALFDDGLYVVTGTARRNLTAGVNTPWLKAMAGAGDSVGGASQGIFYLCDTNGDVLAYDWDQDEFFNRTFSAQPAGFFYSDDRRALVAKVGGAFYEVGSSVSSIAWAISFGKQGDYRHRPVPGFASIDCDGEMILSVRVDGSLVRSYALDGTEDVPLPIDRGRFYQLGLSGTGTEADTEIRSLSTR